MKGASAMLDHKYKGHQFRPIIAVVEHARLRAFFRAIGETNPTVIEPDASGRVAIPPTYLFCLEMLDADNPLGFLEELDTQTDQALHADQTFAYHLPVYVGDRLTFRGRVSDIVEKKNGLLTFVIQDVQVLNQDNQLVAEVRRTIVLKQRVPTSK
jgi:hypothetical protein